MPFLNIEAKMENLEKAIDFVFSISKTIGFEKINLNRISLASEEIFVNIIKHAYPNKKGTIEIKCNEFPERKGIFLEVSDYGIPFNPLSYIPPDTLKLPLEKRPIGGLGIYLICTIMDILYYKWENNKNIFTVIKYL